MTATTDTKERQSPAASLVHKKANLDEMWDVATGVASDPSATATVDCSTGALQTLEPDVLTVATDQPAYEPWVVDDDPTNKQGYEAAVAYAVAGQLGFDDDQAAQIEQREAELLAEQDAAGGKSGKRKKAVAGKTKPRKLRRRSWN